MAGASTIYSPTLARVDQETRDLLDELNVVQNTLKPGSLEREKREDAVYKRLYDIADYIKTDHSHDPRMQEIYFVITEERLESSQASPSATPDVEGPSDVIVDSGGLVMKVNNKTVKQFPVYGDPYRMYTKYPSTAKTQLYLEQMALDLGAMNPVELQSNFESVDEDGTKKVMRSMLGKCQREKWMTSQSKKCCAPCWREVMQQMFLMGCEILTVEMKTRSHQIAQMTERGQLTMEDARYLAEYIEKVMNQLEKLLTQSKRGRKSKKEWIYLVESVYRLMVGMINEIMMKVVQMLKVKASVQNDQVTVGLLA